MTPLPVESDSVLAGRLTEGAPLEKFTHELGLKEIVAEEKLSVTAASLPAEGEETRVVVMKRAQ